MAAVTGGVWGLGEVQERAAECYRTATSPPSFLSAVILPRRGVLAQASQPDLKTGKRRVWAKTYTAPHAEPSSSFPLLLSDNAILSVSPDGTRMLVFINPTEGAAGTKHATVEEWGVDGFVRTIIGPDDKDVPFGAVHAVDTTFGCIEWLVGGSSEAPGPPTVLFCAESRVKITSALAPWQSGADASGGGIGADASASVDEFQWRESWGEQHTDMILPRLFALDLAVGSVEAVVLPGHLAGWSLGKGCWAPPGFAQLDKRRVVFTAWPPGTRLGVIYCTNRPSQMYSAAVGDLASPSFVAGTDSAAAKSPMFTLAGDALLFLETKVGGPHCQSARLIAIPWPLRPLHEAVPTVLVDHGLLYGSALVGSKCWLDSDTLVIRTQHHSKSVLVEVKLRRTTDAAMDAGGHQVLRTDPGLGVGEGSFNLLAAKDGCIVAVFSNPSTPAVLLLGNTLEDRWTPLSPILSVAVLHRVINLTDGGHGRGEAIVYEPAPTEGEATPPPTSRPLIVWPHGGPHSMTEYGYSAYAAAFVAMGFVVVAPNYVGSAGFGDESILELASGHCGTLDVADVNGSVDAVIAAKLCSPDAVVAFGGSHGGFLSAHLSAQFPSRYKATVIRNPVIDMANMVGSTDIPSWCWTESGLQYSADAVPSADVLGRMHDASPLAWVDQVRAPSLVLIGLKDARVPVSQGFLWHKALRARGIKTEVRTYPDDCHPLSSTKCAADVFVHTVIWMHKCLAGPHGGRSRPATIVWARLADEDTSRLWPARVLPASEHASVRALTRTVQLFGPASRLTDVPHDALVRFAPSLPGHSDLIAEGATAGLAGFDVAVQQAETALALARA